MDMHMRKKVGNDGDDQAHEHASGHATRYVPCQNNEVGYG